MPYVPGFNYDLFISYGSADNVDGWVQKFEKQLTGELTRLLGRPFSDKSIFLDQVHLHVGQDYVASLHDAARESALLVVLLSPSYLTSAWCTSEYQKFQEKLASGATLAQSQVICLLCPTDGPLPATLANSQHLNFVVPGKAQPFSPGSNTWLELVNKLAVEIRDLLQDLRRRAGAVFVGQPLQTDMKQREALSDYLANQHFRATPNHLADLHDRALAQRALTESVAAVHFIGGASPAALESIEDSIDHCKGPTILFNPFDRSLTGDEKVLLSQLPAENYPHRLGPDEVELKRFLEDLLTRRHQPPSTPASLGLICEMPDFPWAQSFTATGLSVAYPSFLQDKLTFTEQRRRWSQIFKNSHGLLFYHGASKTQYLDALEDKAVEESSTALRRRYLDDPALDAKRASRPADPVYPQGLNEFLDEVRRKADSKGTP